MDTDLALIIGIFLAGLSIPSILSVISEGRPPRMPMILVMVAGGLILYALNMNPGGYSFDQVPDVFLRVIPRYTP